MTATTTTTTNREASETMATATTATTTNPNEDAYLALLRDVRESGRRVPTRATLMSTGGKVDALAVFGRQVRYDLGTGGFPLLTTKRVDFDAIAHELCWFLAGRSDAAYLRERGVRIWELWADERGSLGRIYGPQWRAWRAPGGGTVDQIARLVAGIRAVAADPTAPEGRRLIVSAWNPGELGEMALPPCHVLAQFHVDAASRRLSCQFYQRSADLFLGVPFNVTSYALLTHLLAHVCGLGVGELVHAIGDAHVYANHLDAVDEQLARTPLPSPALWLSPEVRDIDDFRRADARVIGYAHHPALRGEVAV